MANTQAISELLKRATDAGDVPGVVVAAGTAEGPIFAGASGVRDTASGAPMTADTVVWIASMTKAVTGACAMQLVEQGRLSLDAPIATVLPQLGNVQVLEGFAADGSARLRPARRPITLRHLLTHTAGFVYDIWNPDMARYLESSGTPGIISCANAALSIPLVFDPGERWDYGIGIDWAGKAVEAVSGQRLSAYMQQNLLQPLGMTDTGFKIGPAQRQRLAKVHNRTPDGFEATDMELPQEPEFEMGGGGLYSTVGDYLRFARMILNGGTLDGTRVLARETVATMSANAMGDLVCRPLKTAAPPFSNDVDFIDGMQWGLSFLINPQPLPTGRSAGSLAWAGLANSYFWIDPDRQVTGVFATQVLPFFDEKAVRLLQEFETAVYRLA
ncbi:MAG TPA: serine hydrolase domain-containing protein [Acetobacteraceae bacterium]|nr:serine hydrolase domain-containing protein [Acetobacteraceae bacterium]